MRFVGPTLSRLVSVGLRSSDDPREAKRVRITNGIALVMLLPGILFGALYAWIGQWWPGFGINVLYVFHFLIVPFLSSCRWFQLSRWYLVFSTNLLILLGTYVFGRQMGMQVAYYALACLPFLVFESRQRISNTVAMLLSVGCFVAIETLNGFEGIIPSEKVVAGPLGESLVVIGCLWGMVYYFRLSNERFENRLESLLRSNDAQHRIIVQTSKMSALGEMAGGIAHEINNPLTTIQMRATLLRRGLERKSIPPEALMDSVLTIEATVGRIAKIVQGLRSFSREGLDDPFQRVGARTLVEDTLAFCQERFRSQGIEVDLSGIPDGLWLECRPVQVSQILLNLLGNAFDALAGQPEKWVRIAARDLEPFIVLEVTDSGPGIPAGIRDKIFQPFFTTKEIGHGTGLGLSISKGLAESQGGRLELNPLTKQTRFELWLPKHQRGKS